MSEKKIPITPPSPAEGGAPSGVSDAMVERATEAWKVARDLASVGEAMEYVLSAALEAAQPQPGRVEGMEDTKRMDWLSMNPLGADMVIDNKKTPCIFWGISAAPNLTVREAIDAAMKAKSVRG